MARRRRRAQRERPGRAGFLVVDKPAGYTSHDVVDEARKWLGIRRVGHLGTLDPQATGVLPLAVRGATKLVPFFQSGDKSYVGTVCLGVETDTLDGEGEVLWRHEGPLPDEESVRRALASFTGDIEQIPPMYSAVKRAGVPLHRLARMGEEVERAPKQVHIARLELVSFSLPEVGISVECGAGTYVRTLASDLGRLLGCGGHLASLRRVRNGPFDLGQALGVEECQRIAADGRLDERLIPPEEALGLPVIELAPPAAQRVANGGDISPGTLHRAEPGTKVAALGPEGRMIAVLELRLDRRLWPLRVLPGNGS